MGSLAVSGKTAILQISTEVYPDAPVVWNDIGEVIRIGDIRLDRQVFNTHENGPGKLVSTAKVGIMTPIDFSFEVNVFDSSIEQGLLADITEAEPFVHWYKIQWPQMSGVPTPPSPLFPGKKTGLSLSTPLGGLIRASIKIAVCDEISIQ